MVAIQLDEDVVAALRSTQEPIDSVARELIVMGLYRRGVISGGKAARLLGMSRRDFMRSSGEFGVPYFDTTDEEWDAERKTIRSS